MAWRCSGNTNAELIANLVDKGLIKLDRVAAVSCFTFYLPVNPN